MFLFDTVALSEATKAVENPGFAAWRLGVEPDSVHTSVLCLGELHRGAAGVLDRDKGERLAVWLDGLVTRLGERVLPIDRAVASAWGALGKRGTVHVADALIASTAKIHDLIVVTRNTRDFDGLGVAVLNPWTAVGEAGEAPRSLT